MKTVWIVDGAYLFNYGKTRPNGIDYLKLKNELVKLNGGQIYEGYYLNSTQEPPLRMLRMRSTRGSSRLPLKGRMRVQLYKLKDMHCTCPSCSDPFDRQVQKGVDVGIATLIIKLAAQNVYERLILSAGDGDFEDAASYIKSELHKEFWLNGSQFSLSSDLQSYADNVLWLDDMIPAIDK